MNCQRVASERNASASAAASTRAQCGNKRLEFDNHNQLSVFPQSVLNTRATRRNVPEWMLPLLVSLDANGSSANSAKSFRSSFVGSLAPGRKQCGLRHACYKCRASCYTCHARKFLPLTLTAVDDFDSGQSLQRHTRRHNVCQSHHRR